MPFWYIPCHWMISIFKLYLFVFNYSTYLKTWYYSSIMSRKISRCTWKLCLIIVFIWYTMICKVLSWCVFQRCIFMQIPPFFFVRWTFISARSLRDRLRGFSVVQTRRVREDCDDGLLSRCISEPDRGFYCRGQTLAWLTKSIRYVCVVFEPDKAISPADILTWERLQQLHLLSLPSLLLKYLHLLKLITPYLI